MTGARLAAALVDRGLDPSELAAKEALFTAVVETHAMVRGREPAHAWWIPGRLEILGKHTDYAGGRSLVCAVPRGFALVATPREDRIVRVTDAWRGEDVSVQAVPRPPSYTGWRHYVEVAVHRFARNFPGCAFGADIVLASDLPRAAGMSSSSALVVGVAAALGAMGDVRKHRAWQANIRTPLDAAAYYACIENGRRFGTLDGDAGVGTHGGSEDHAAIVEGRHGVVSAFGFVPPRAIDAAPMPREWRFVLAPSGVAASKTGAARSAYNRLSAGAGALLSLWNQSHSGSAAVSLASALSSGPGGIERLRDLARRSSIPDWTPDDLARRLQHFVREDARILPALDGFRRANATDVGILSDASQQEADVLLGNQVKETIALARRARETGAFAASSFGAGFGGSVWALTTADAADEFAGAWHRHAFVARPGPPLTALA